MVLHGRPTQEVVCVCVCICVKYCMCLYMDAVICAQESVCITFLCSMLVSIHTVNLSLSVCVCVCLRGIGNYRDEKAISSLNKSTTTASLHSFTSVISSDSHH